MHPRRAKPLHCCNHGRVWFAAMTKTRVFFFTNWDGTPLERNRVEKFLNLPDH